MQKYSFNKNRFRILIRLILSSLFFIGCVWLWIARENGLSPFSANRAVKFSVLIASYLGPFLMGTFWLRSLYTLFFNNVGLTLSATGVYDQTTFGAIGALNWESIDKIVLHENSRGRGTEMIFFLKDANKMLSEYGYFKRLILKGFQGINRGFIGVPLWELNGKETDIIQSLMACKPDELQINKGSI